jgi:hypothetical protein
VAKVGAKSKTVTYEWVRDRSNYHYDSSADRKIGCKLTIKAEKVLNVSAYKPGDFHQFFDDPRTRQDYLKWAWLLLEAEEYHAGNREVADLTSLPPRQRTRLGSARYHTRKRLKALVGKAVRLAYEVETKGGRKYEKGSLWRVTGLERGKFSIHGILPDGTKEHADDWDKRRYVFGVSEYEFRVDHDVPPEPKAKVVAKGGLATAAKVFEEGDEGKPAEVPLEGLRQYIPPDCEDEEAADGEDGDDEDEGLDEEDDDGIVED